MLCQVFLWLAQCKNCNKNRHLYTFTRMHKKVKDCKTTDFIFIRNCRVNHVIIAWGTKKYYSFPISSKSKTYLDHFIIGWSYCTHVFSPNVIFHCGHRVGEYTSWKRNEGSALSPFFVYCSSRFFPKVIFGSRRLPNSSLKVTDVGLKGWSALEMQTMALLAIKH